MKRILLLFVCTFMMTAHAQDQGENGANRRVTTPNGYDGVIGSFSEPVINNPFNRRQQNNTDTPQMYLGVRGNVEVDAGVTWIPRLNPSGAVNTNHSNWSAFSRVSGGAYVQIWVNGAPWIVPRGRLNQIEGQLFVRGDANGDNHVRISLLHNGIEIARNTPVPVSANGQQVAQNMIAKRVTAMTQSDGAHLDGSFMRETRFSEGRVKAVRYNATEGTFEGVGNWVDWDSVGGNASHYYPWGRYGQPTNTTSTTVTVVDPTLPWVINSGGIHKRHASGLTANVASAFSDETVTIQLFAQRPVVARRARNRRR